MQLLINTYLCVLFHFLHRMAIVSAYEQVFNRVDFSSEPLAFQEFEACTFKACNFSKQDLSRVNFIECAFIECELSMCKFMNTGFKDISFDRCKLLGLYFNDCNSLLLGFKFKKCHLNLCTFQGVSLKKTISTNAH